MFDGRHYLYGDLHEDAEARESEPRERLRAIAPRGGVFEKDDGKSQAGELRRRREAQAFGRLRGIEGVGVLAVNRLRMVNRAFDWLGPRIRVSQKRSNRVAEMHNDPWLVCAGSARPAIRCFRDSVG